MSIILHSIPGSGNTTPIHLLVAEANIEVDDRVLAVWEGKQFDPEFLAINPVSCLNRTVFCE